MKGLETAPRAEGIGMRNSNHESSGGAQAGNYAVAAGGTLAARRITARSSGVGDLCRCCGARVLEID